MRAESRTPAMPNTRFFPNPDLRKATCVIANEPEPALKEGTTTVSVLEENRLPLYVGGGVLAAALGALISFFIVQDPRLTDLRQAPLSRRY